MNKYFCYKTVHATDMKRNDYVDHIKQTSPERCNTGLKRSVVDEPGYLVIYNKDTDRHYESWSPKLEFEGGYERIDVPYENERIMSFFKYDHLPENLQKISRPLCNLALMMACILTPQAEKTAGMRKLLEAKDCFVRAHLHK